MNRVVVIGCPGAGKTEFSKQLARITGLPVVHLDRIYHDQSKDYLNNREAWIEAIKKEISKPRWIIDGNYKSTFALRLPAADTIIFMDYPTYVCMARAIKRRFKFHRRVRPDMPPTWREKFGWGFFLFILRFNRNDAPNIREMLVQYQDSKKVMVLRLPQQAKAYLSSELARVA